MKTSGAGDVTRIVFSTTAFAAKLFRQSSKFLAGRVQPFFGYAARMTSSPPLTAAAWFAGRDPAMDVIAQDLSKHPPG